MKKGKQQSISKMWDNVKQPNVYAIKVPENRLRRQNPTPTDPRAQQTHAENMSRHFIIKLHMLLLQQRSFSILVT